MNVRAEIPLEEGARYFAPELSRSAQNLHEHFGDPAGQIDSLACLAGVALQLGLTEEALGSAERCLVLAYGRPVSRAELIAWHVLVSGLERVGQIGDMRAVIERFFDVHSGREDSPALAAVRSSFERTLAGVEVRGERGEGRAD